MEPAEKMGSESHFILHRKDRDWCRNGIQEGQDHRFSRGEEKGGRFYRDLY